MEKNNQSLARDLLAGGNEHFHIASQPTRVVFWMTDAHGACELVSPNWETLTGQTPEEARGEGWLQQVAPGDRTRMARAVREAVTAQRGFFLRYDLLCRDGKTVRVLHDTAVRQLPSRQFNGLIASLTDESDQAAGESSLEQSAQRVYDFLERVPLAAVAIDFSGRVVHANAVLAERSGIELADLIGEDWIGRMVAEGDRPAVRRLIDGTVAPSDLPIEIEYHVGPADSLRLYRWHLTLLRDAEGQPVSLAMMGGDITRWRRVGEHQRLTAQMYDPSREAMVITDPENRIVSVNSSFTRLTGYAPEEVIGQNPRILQSGKHDKEFYRQMWDSILTLGHWRGDIWDRRKDGTFYPKFLAITAVRNGSGDIVNYSAIFYDVTERKALEEELDHLAHYDMLTGLPNRMLLQDRLEQAIAAAERQRQHFALLFIDLDGFKPVNDRYGHGAGDRLLMEVGRRLLEVVRAMDTAARLGGDEFVVILTDVKNTENARRVADKILESLCLPYELGEWADAPIVISASIGVSIYPNDELVANELLRTADQAMYRAKREGKRRIEFHRPPE